MTRSPKSPTQQRGKQRVAHLLAAADAEIARVGYDAVTMSQIAERAGAAIGSLYQFFPNKEVLVQELRRKYCADLVEIWSGLRELEPNGRGEFVAAFVKSTLSFLSDHRSFLALIYAPASTKPPRVSRDLEMSLADVLRKQNLGKSRAQLERRASVILQLSKSMMTMYVSARVRDRRWITQEFEEILSAYLAGVERREN